MPNPAPMIPEDDLADLREIARASRAPAPDVGWRSVGSSTYQKILKTAAFLGRFEPARLFPDAGVADLRQLLNVCNVAAEGDTTQWILKADERRKIFADVATTVDGLRAGVDEAQQQLQALGASAGDALSQALASLASGARIDPAVASREALAAYRSVLGWLPEASSLPVSPRAELRRIELEELLEAFRFLTGYDPQTGRDLFVGRDKELRDLRVFADVLESEGIGESIRRAVRRVAGRRPATMILSGVGGIGKSTLLAKFILQHVQPDAGQQMWFAYLDFDRSTVTAAQPGTLLLEIVRQLSWQLPAGHDDLRQLRAQVREWMEQRQRAAGSTASESGTASRQAAAMHDARIPPDLLPPQVLYSFLSGLSRQITSSDAPDLPLLLVFDTLEEAQALGDEAVRRLQGFIEAVHAAMPQTRVLIAGRDDAKGFFTTAARHTLEEFADRASRQSFLERRGVSPSISAQVADEVGGRPLALLLAARLVREKGADAASVSFVDTLRGLFRKRLIEGILYGRILDHVAKDLRDLVHPGLVLRRIDHDVVRQVMLPVLGHPDLSDDRIAAILDVLRRQKDLVRVEPDGSVRHRADIRGQMLELMREEKPRETEALHRAAADYYLRRQADPANAATAERDRVEELYHRLAAGLDLDTIPGRWTSRARLDLASAVDEIAHVGGRGTLKVMLDRSPTDEEGRALPVSLRREWAIRTIKASLSADEPERALAVLSESGDLLPDDKRLLLERRTFDRAGKWDQARNLKGWRSHTNPRDWGIMSIPVKSAQGAWLLPLEDWGMSVLEAADFVERVVDEPEKWSELARFLSELAVEGVPWRPGELLAIVRLQARLARGGLRRASADDVTRGWYDDRPWPITATPTNDQFWFITLTDEVDRTGFAICDGMPMIEVMRNQVRFLGRLLDDARQSTPVLMAARSICEVMEKETRIFRHVARRIGIPETDIGPAESLVLRHVMRPATPQWYVPLACALRRDWRQSIPVSALYDSEMPTLPFEPASSCGTTKSLADLFAQFDGLGVLHIVLGRFTARTRLSDGDFRRLVSAYGRWRADLFADIDGLIDPLLPPVPRSRPRA
ncbi:AAA family ATPase [Vineibacter terrae]|uniref:AAA family ATPase n=1 Tax=Vineibacter terrae TaxID=2586908 RepID=UPI001E4F93F0|nr:ATP-binding protein [Vineibacter terrae]